MDELDMVRAALNNLREKNHLWTASYITFTRKPPVDQAKWWYLAKIQAKKGAPAMVTLQNEFLKQRLKS